MYDGAPDYSFASAIYWACSIYHVIRIVKVPQKSLSGMNTGIVSLEVNARHHVRIRVNNPVLVTLCDAFHKAVSSAYYVTNESHDYPVFKIQIRVKIQF